MDTPPTPDSLPANQPTLLPAAASPMAAPQHVIPAAERRDEPVPMPLVMIMLLPVRVIRNNWRAMSALRCYLVHMVGVVIGALGIGLSLYVNEQFWWQNGNFYDDHYHRRYGTYMPGEIFEGAILYFGIVELCYLFAAFTTVCWAAAPEPWGKSYLRSLKRWWQLTPFHAALTIVFVAFAGLMDDMHMDMAPYFFLGLATLGYTLAVIYSTLASMRIYERKGGWAPRCRWPMTCEGCGYALYGLAMDQSCPECGRLVAHTADCGRGRLELPQRVSDMVRLAFQPAVVGRQLLAHRPANGQGNALSKGIGLLIAGGAVSTFVSIIVVMIAIGEGAYIDTEVVLGVLITMLFAGSAAAGVMLWVALLATSLVGSFFSWFAKQNVMHVAAQALAYTSAALPIWVMFNAIVFGLILSILSRLFLGPSPAWTALVPVLFLLGNATLLGAYMIMITRTVKAARWANI